MSKAEDLELQEQLKLLGMDVGDVLTNVASENIVNEAEVKASVPNPAQQFAEAQVVQPTQTTVVSQSTQPVETTTIKPEVSVENFVAEVYTANSTLTIKDPAGRIVEAPTFEIYKDGKIYLRRIFSKSGEIQITGLVPETEYEVVGKFIYLNENNQKVENTFYEGSFINSEPCE